MPGPLAGDPKMFPDAPTSHAFGAFIVHSPSPLPNLPRAGADPAPGITLAWAASGPPDGIGWDHHWTEGDEVLLSLARQDEGYWLRVPGHADFLVRLRPATVKVWPLRTPLDGATLEHLLVDQILPRVATQLGATLVHASSVRIGQRHVLFMGPSGRGKSTLAGLLYRSGCPVLSDDCAQLITRRDGQIQVVPTYPSLRLCSDSLSALFPGQADTAPVASYSSKRRVPISAADPAAAFAKVDAIYLLDDPAPGNNYIHIAPVSPAAACLALIRHSFRLDLSDREASALQLQQCAQIAKSIPAFRLAYPRDHRRSSELVNALLAHVDDLPAPSTSTTVP